MKGNVTDLVVIPLFIVLISATIVISFLLLDTFNTTIQDIPAFGVNATAAAQAGVDSFLFWDSFVIILVIGLYMVTLISAYFIQTHPIFFGIAFIFLIVSIIVSAQITNIYIDFATSNDTITNAANQFPYMLLFFTNLPTILTSMGAGLLIVLYSTFRDGGVKF